MMRVCFRYLIFTVAALSVVSCRAMVFDNRFFPLIQYPYITVEDRPSHLACALFVTTANRAVGENETEIGIPQLYGNYDQRELALSMVKAGFPNPLRSSFQLLELPWNTEGKIQAQGVQFSYHQALTDWLAIGFYWMAMRAESSIEYFCNFGTVTGDEKLELANTRSSMNTTIGLTCPHATQAGMGDLDLYLRACHSWDYTAKFRKVTAGLRFGVLVPSGVKRNLASPLSVPFGGNGHWGVYVSGDTELEVKEDWKAGLLFRLSKRFEKTMCHRMPVCKEPENFGVVVGQANVNPGLTAIVSPYLTFENLREGFGVRLQYTFIEHRKDCWKDERCDKSVPVNLEAIINRSNWISSYVTLNAFYDFGKVKVHREFDPILLFSWDIPVTFFDAHGVAKTNKISFGFEYNF